ncbi:hypothetical protein [Halonatronum saccharophilum]|uniref:hypothetical protein n=1 Tax=Halonatronum saccharophilum TaxID=150060 RepID=UPI00048779DD|nr:hypothetical protein [Halonatronum saccharophilum]
MKKGFIIFMLAVSLVFVVLSSDILAQPDEVLIVDSNESIIKIMDDIYISEEMVVDGDVVAIMGNVKVDGRVKGDLVSIMGNIDINNKIDGDLVSIMGRVNEGPTAQVGGDNIQIIGGRGIIIRDKFKFSLPHNLFRWSFRISRFLILLALVALTYALLPKQEEAMALALEEEPLKKIGKGFLSLLVFPLIIVATLLSIVGIPLVPFIIIAFFIIRFIGYIGVALFVGNRVNNTAKANMNVYLRLLIGVTILWLVRLVPVIGVLTSIIVTAFALGLILDTKFGTGNPWFKRYEVDDSSDED